jgi:AbrB family looped-hinge helix DNA binding protein
MRSIVNVKLSQKGWIVIPATLREKYGLKPGTDLSVVDYGGVLALVPASQDPVKEGLGILKGADSLTQALLDERQEERERESG